MFNKYKIDKNLIIYLLMFFIISLLSINKASIYLPTYNLLFKQILWYIIGIIFIFIIIKIKNEYIYKSWLVLYLTGILFLGLLLIIGNPINGSKCWFILPGIGSIQPSEFMKIFLILALAININNFKTKYKSPTTKDELLLIIKLLTILIIPTILTFLEPDTGVVLIYIFITFIMILSSPINKKWFIILLIIAIILLGLIVYLYLFKQNIFIKIFSSNIYYRIKRLIDWKKSTGYQLESSLVSIGSSGLLGHKNAPLYFPEPATDFIFSIFVSSYGLIGGLILIITIILFDLHLIKLSINANNTDRYVLAGIAGMFIFNQIQNIAMTIGLLPITGITLPFISYGGSSLLSYMIIIGIILNIYNKTKSHQK